MTYQIWIQKAIG